MTMARVARMTSSMVSTEVSGLLPGLVGTDGTSDSICRCPAIMT
jgi:hypothetical protein